MGSITPLQMIAIMFSMLVSGVVTAHFIDKPHRLFRIPLILANLAMAGIVVAQVFI